METIIALDIGTTGAKAAAVSRDGKVQASGFATYPTFTPDSGWCEQEPLDWWRAGCRALQQLRSNLPGGLALTAIALSGQMQDIILLGAKGALGRAILYSDSRAHREAGELDERIGAARLAQLTGNTQGAASVLAKWLWLSSHTPTELHAGQTILLGAHDYLCWRLCGARSTDHVTAATTGLLDLHANAWLVDVVQSLGLDQALLPKLRAAGDLCGYLTDDAARATGLPVKLPVFQGVGDLGATTVGVGAGIPGHIYCYLGTSGWIATSLDDATLNPEGGVFTLRHPDPQRFIQVAPMLTAGGNLEWIRSSVFRSDLGAGDTPAIDYATLNRLAQSAPVGSHGLLYLPYLAGERSPFTDPDARACFIGLSVQTTPAELVRAVMEGTAMAYRSLRDALEIQQEAPISLAGGGAKSPIWPQILADVLDCPVHVLSNPGDAPARGAAIIVGKSLGWYRDYAPSSHFFPVSKVFQPLRENTRRYNRLYSIFHSLYPKLQTPFAELSLFRSM